MNELILWFDSNTSITMRTLCLFLLCLLQVYQIRSKQPKIIIIGAGPSGIAAATYLWEHNFTNIEILEAENRIGGRINSVKFGDAYVDLGAQWCHGEKNNIVYEKVKDLNLLEHMEEGDAYFYSSGKPLSDEFVRNFYNITSEAQSVAEDDLPENKTLGEVLKESYLEAINERFRGNKEDLKIAEDALDYVHLTTLGVEGSFSWYDPVARTTYETCEGDQGLNWKGKGYKTILEVLLKKYPDPNCEIPLEDKLSLNKVVKKIKWNVNDTKTEIKCTDESTYTADHVIFTPSLGVLKEENGKMFDPALPLQKKEAIDKIGFGAVIKVWMYYPEPWWNNLTYSRFGFIWDREDIKSITKEFSQGPSLDGRLWITYLSELNAEKYNPTVISAWFTGPLVPEIEKISEDIMKDGLQFAMNKFLGHLFEIKKPEKILQTRWYNNPNFRGTYSFQTIQTCSEDNVCAESELAEPIRNSEGYPLIQFAGEATHLYHFSTVHGAIESGYREAKTIVNLYP